MKCFACGIKKDRNQLEKYPYPEEDHIVSYPIDPLFTMDCEPTDSINGVWKRVIICHECYHKLNPDMWINQEMWEALNPKITFDLLPDLYQPVLISNINTNNNPNNI